MAEADSRKGFLGALLLGLFAIPAMALGTGTLLSSAPTQPQTAAFDAPSEEGRFLSYLSLSPPAEMSNQAEGPENDLSADLVVACGRAALDLVALETEGNITPLQQAALDALRQVCADNGYFLPAAPEPAVTEVVVEEVVTVVEVAAPAPAEQSWADDDQFEDDGLEDDDDDDEGD